MCVRYFNDAKRGYIMQQTETKAVSPVTVRIAMWSARHRWPVIGLWFAVTLGLFVLSLIIGTKTISISGGSDDLKTESAKANAAFRAIGVGGRERFQLIINHPTLKATDPAFQAVKDDVTGQLNALTYYDNGTPKPVLVLDDPQNPPTATPSPDLTSYYVSVIVAGKSGDAEAKIAPARAIVERARAAHPDYTIASFTSIWINNDFREVINHDLDGTLKITLPLTLLILFLAFGTVIAPFVPLLLGLTSLLAAFGLVSLYSNLITPNDPNAVQVVVVIGLAVGIDYSLFLITRYRTELRHGRSKLAALEVASGTAGRAVFFSGLTVMISLGGLFLVDDPAFKSIAAGTIAVVLMSVIGSLTFLPATLAVLGGLINWGRIPFFGREREEGQGIWSRLVGVVMRRPVISAVLSAALLLALASPTLHLRLGSTTNDIDSLPGSIEGVQMLKVLRQHFPQRGTLDANVVIVADKPNRDDIKAFVPRMIEAGNRVSSFVGTAAVKYYPNDANWTIAQITFNMSGTSNDQKNFDAVNRMRADAVPSVFGGVAGANVYVTGGAAYTLDKERFYSDYLPLIFAFVLGLSFVLLLVVFHSIVIPIKAILLNLLSTAACYGALVLVFQDNWFADQIGTIRVGVIESFAPAFIFTILFGLSMDYHLFILTRIKEARDRGLSSNAAVARGIAVTSGTITSAAAIMVAVFAVMATLQVTVIRQLGLGLALAVFLDSTIIRSILLPATMRLLGDWNWYLPGFLRWLPNIAIEGESEEYEAAPAVRETVASEV